MRAAEQDRDDVAAARATWRTDPDAGVGGVAPERLVFLDGCGVLTNLACLHGRAPRGQRALGTAPAGRWERVTVLGALGVDGIMAAMSVEAATDAAVFTAYLDAVLLPKLREVRPDAVLVMDNLAAHKTPAVRAALEASGFAHRYLPSYSPDLNPIEPSWAKLKGKLRQAAARTLRIHRRQTYTQTALEEGVQREQEAIGGVDEVEEAEDDADGQRRRPALDGPLLPPRRPQAQKTAEGGARGQTTG